MNFVSNSRYVEINHKKTRESGRAKCSSYHVNIGINQLVNRG